jgi:hypothetical protein
VLLGCNAVALVPTSCLVIAVAANPWNPMQVAFVEGVTVVNQTSEPIWITPLGAWDRTDRRAPMPVFESQYPAKLATRAGGLLVRPGLERTVFVDWDDIELSGFAIERSDDRTRVLTLREGPARCCHSAPIARVEISSLSELPIAPPDILEVVQRAKSRQRLAGHAAIAAPFVSFGILCGLWFVLSRRLR